MDIIKIQHLSKSYKDVLAVDDISFNVEKGSLFAFLGVNGAGKSTTINIICTLLEKDKGEVIVNNHDIDKEAKAIKKEIGVVFQQSVLDPTLTVKDNLSVRASLYGIVGKEWKSRLRELAEELNLEDVLNRPYGKLSGGQRRRVDIARALINKPEILFLDEPTTGLDPQTRILIWNIVKKLQVERATTIFLTTHYMEEAEDANMVAIIEKGHIIAFDTPINLKQKYSGSYLKIYRDKDEDFEKILEGHKFTYENTNYRVFFNDVEDIKNYLLEHKDDITDFEVIKGNMDDVFINATGRSLREAHNEN